MKSLLGVVLLLAMMPLAFRMEPSNFAIFGDPRVWRFLGDGVVLVAISSVVAVLLSLPLAVMFALGRLSSKAVLRWPSIAYIEGIRALPTVPLEGRMYFVDDRVGELRNVDDVDDRFLLTKVN